MKTIEAGGSTYEIQWTTGTVSESGKNLETQIRGSGGGGATFGGYGGNAPVRIESKTIVHDQLFLVDASGVEHSFQLQNFNLAARQSNELSVLWAIKKGSKTGKYITVLNHSTRNAFHNNQNLESIHRRSTLLMLAVMLLCFILSASLGGVLFILGILIPIAWLIEGKIGAKKFKENLRFEEYK